MRISPLIIVLLAMLGVVGCKSAPPATQPTKHRDRMVTIRGEVNFRPDVPPPPGVRLQIAVRSGRFGPPKKELVFENVKSWPVSYEFVLPEILKGADYMVMAHAFTGGQLTHIAPARGTSSDPYTLDRVLDLTLVPVRE